MVDLTQFALTGDKTPIPDADLPGGFSCGNFSRQTLNWLLAQMLGSGAALTTPLWAAGTYPSGAVVSNSGKQYRNESCSSTTAVPPDAPWVERTTAELYANPVGTPVVVPLHCATASYSPGAVVSAGGLAYRQEGDTTTTLTPPASPWVLRTLEELYANVVGTPLVVPLWYAGTYSPGVIRSHSGVLYRQEGVSPTSAAPPAAPWVPATLEGTFANPVGCQLTVPYWAAGNYAPDAVVCFGGNYYVNRSAAITGNIPPAMPWEQVSLIDLLAATSIKWVRAGQSLPTTNVGPVWSDTYNSLMTWQAFSANGASYIGYASQDVGRVILESQPTPRQGYIKSGTMNLSKTAYAALWNWAVHYGLQVAIGTWAAGGLVYADNGDGTFRVADVRSQFPRFWADGGTIDTTRAFGSWQPGSLVFDHALIGWGGNTLNSGQTIAMGTGIIAQTPPAGSAFRDGHDAVALASAEADYYPSSAHAVSGYVASLGYTRPVNTAFLAAIKY